MRYLPYVILCGAVFFASCTGKKGGTSDDMERRIDSLNTVVAEKDAAMEDIFMSMNAIAENLNSIKLRENIINRSIQGNAELDEATSAQISRDVEAINQLLIANRETIAKLNTQVAQLKNANANISGLEKLIAELNIQIDSKDQEIRVLQGTIRGMQDKVETLTAELYDVSMYATELEENNVSLEGEVKIKTDILSTGYYIIGSEKELLAKEIVYKRGFIGRTLKINENRSLENFTQVDIRDFDELLIGGRKATVISTHPAGSYEFVANSDGTIDTLKITDKARFWEYSKVLVVSYK